jgi:eukaryotic-like serine/threonine-protein kinase
MNEENKDLYTNFKPLSNHFQAAFEEKSTQDTLFYDEISNLHDRYQKEAVIDHGGMKQVSSYSDRFTMREVAFAELLDSDKPSNIDRFIREARLTASLQHPSIMPIYDMGLNDDGEPFFTMKLFQGLRLDEWRKKLNTPQSQTSAMQEAIQIFVKVCQAISYAHANGVIHLDLKPENIGVGAYGEVLVFDWGIAKIIDDFEDSPTASLLDPQVYNDATLNGVVKGSPGYLAPEQIDSKFGSKDERTDVYALGGILYFILSGLKPIKSNGDLMESLNKTVQGEIISPSKRVDFPIPESLEAVTMKALSREQDKRYHNVEELLDEVNLWLNGFATHAENASFSRSLMLLMKRHKDVTFVLSLMSIIIIYGISQIIMSERRAVKNEQEAIAALALYKNEKEQTKQLGKEVAPYMVNDLLKELSESSTYDFDKALRIAQTTVDRDPDFTEARLVLGRTHFIRQEFNLAAQELSLLPTSQTQHNKLYELAKQYASIKTDQELLSIKELINLMNELKHMQMSFLMAGYAEQKAHDLKDKIRIAEHMLKVTNKLAAPSMKLKIKVLDDNSLDIDLSNNPKLTSLSGIRNLKVKKLDISNTSIKITLDLSRMPLETLIIKNSQIPDMISLTKLKNLKDLVIAKEDYPSFANRKKINGVNIMRK